MSRIVACATLALVLFTGTAFALSDGGLDGGFDAGTIDGAVTDASDASADASDATPDAAIDAAADAAVDSSDGAAIKDAKSDVCDPNVEPCTTRADTGPDTDAGDSEEPAANGGCSCDTVPAVASTTPIALLFVAFALLSRRRRRR